MALTTGGSYIRSTSGDLDLDKIYADIQKKVKDKELKSGRQKRYVERFPLFLLFSLLLFLFYHGIKPQLWTLPTRFLRKKEVLLIILF